MHQTIEPQGKFRETGKIMHSTSIMVMFSINETAHPFHNTCICYSKFQTSREESKVGFPYLIRFSKMFLFSREESKVGFPYLIHFSKMFLFSTTTAGI